ncbi:MAG: divergent polysaccharide deacetylase family protein [Pseudomonadota bacterium]
MRSTFAGFLSGTALSALALAGASVISTLAQDASGTTERAVDAAQEVDTPTPDALTASPEASAPAQTSAVAPSPSTDDSAADRPALANTLAEPDPDEPLEETGIEASGAPSPEVEGSEVALAEPEIETGATAQTGLPETVEPDAAIAGVAGLADPDPATAPDAMPRIAPTAEASRIDQSLASRDTAALAPEPNASFQNVDPSSSDRSVETTAGTIGDLARDVKTNRLPVIGGEVRLATDEPSEPDAAPASDLPPLERYAVPFENEAGKPLLSIVLIDDGSLPLGPAALGDFPHPVSFAIDVTRPDAAETAAQYRQAGYEVLAMTDLPATANAQDTEVTMATYLKAIPQAVALFDGYQGGLQPSHEASAQLGDILSDSGHGVILRPNGLNTAQKQMVRKGVPALTFFRDIDGKGEPALTIRRTLDQAVFKAGQSAENVVMVGRLKPETISALILWSLQDRAGSVALAPVSAVLRGPTDTADTGEAVREDG